LATRKCSTVDGHWAGSRYCNTMPGYPWYLTRIGSAHCRGVADSPYVECHIVPHSRINISTTADRIIRVLHASQDGPITLIKVWQFRLIEVGGSINGKPVSVGAAFNYRSRHEHKSVNRSVRGGRMGYYELIVVDAASGSSNYDDSQNPYDRKMFFGNMHFLSLELA